MRHRMQLSNCHAHSNKLCKWAALENVVKWVKADFWLAARGRGGGRCLPAQKMKMKISFDCVCGYFPARKNSAELDQIAVHHNWPRQLDAIGQPELEPVSQWPFKANRPSGRRAAEELSSWGAEELASWRAVCLQKDIDFGFWHRLWFFIELLLLLQLVVVAVVAAGLLVRLLIDFRDKQNKFDTQVFYVVFFVFIFYLSFYLQ